MSEEVFVALIGLLGSVAGSAISALATIGAAWIKEKQRPSCGLFVIASVVGGELGFFAGFLLAIKFLALSTSETVASPMVVQTPTSNIPAVVISTPTLTARTPVSTLSPTAIVSATTNVIPFTPTFPPPDTRNLIRNGSFTDGFTGWERVLLDQGGHSETKIVPFRSGRYGKALHLYHSGAGGVYFRQTVEIPTTHLDFYVTFRSIAESSLFGDPVGITEIILVYLDEQDNELGRTHLTNLPGGIFTDVPCVGCPQTPKSSNVEKFILVENDRLYIDYHIDVYSHVEQELLGVDPNMVKKITILLAVGTTQDKGPSSLEAQLFVTDLRLYPIEGQDIQK